MTADIVALDQSIVLNRLGSYVPGGMVFALANDVEPTGADASDAGKWQLRKGVRPRPLTLRVNVGQCLDVTLHNYLAQPGLGGNTQPATRSLGLHSEGLEWRSGPADDGTNVGANNTPLLPPGDATATYRLYAREEGTFLLYATGDNSSVQPNEFFPMGGQVSMGLFGAVNVEPPGAEAYRSQVIHADLLLAQVPGKTTPDGQPILDYDARYPDDPAKYGAMANKPILWMKDGNALVHGDLTAIITGPDRGNFTSPSASFDPVAPSPDRREPYQEITAIYHELKGTVIQAFDQVYTAPNVAGQSEEADKAVLLSKVVSAAQDGFGINYGVGGVTNEVLANRFEVGPAGKCAECKFEEFFLSSWAQGDPAMVVDKPVWTKSRPGGRQPPGRGGAVPRRSLQRLPQLPRGPREVPGAARGGVAAPHPPPARPPVAAQPRQG